MSHSPHSTDSIANPIPIPIPSNSFPLSAASASLDSLDLSMTTIQRRISLEDTRHSRTREAQEIVETLRRHKANELDQSIREQEEEAESERDELADEADEECSESQSQDGVRHRRVQILSKAASEPTRNKQYTPIAGHSLSAPNRAAKATNSSPRRTKKSSPSSSSGGSVPLESPANSTSSGDGDSSSSEERGLPSPSSSSTPAESPIRSSDKRKPKSATPVRPIRPQVLLPRFATPQLTRSGSSATGKKQMSKSAKRAPADFNRSRSADSETSVDSQSSSIPISSLAADSSDLRLPFAVCPSCSEAHSGPLSPHSASSASRFPALNIHVGMVPDFRSARSSSDLNDESDAESVSSIRSSASSAATPTGPPTRFAMLLNILQMSNGRDKVFKIIEFGGNWFRWLFRAVLTRLAKSRIGTILHSFLSRFPFSRRFLAVAIRMAKRADIGVGKLSEAMSRYRQFLRLFFWLYDLSDVREAYDDWQESRSGSRSSQLLSMLDLINSVLGFLCDLLDDLEWFSARGILPEHFGDHFGDLSVGLWFITVVIDLSFTIAALHQLRKDRQSQIDALKECGVPSPVADSAGSGSTASPELIHNENGEVDSPKVNFLKSLQETNRLFYSESLSMIRYIGDLGLSGALLLKMKGIELSDGFVDGSGFLSALISMIKLVLKQSLHHNTH